MHFLEGLKPDIWGGHHTEYVNLEGKRKRAAAEGVNAWIDPEGYRRFIATNRRAFEDEVDLEMGVKPAKAGNARQAKRDNPAAQSAPQSGAVAVTVHTFVRAETDSYFSGMVKGRFRQVEPSAGATLD